MHNKNRLGATERFNPYPLYFFLAFAVVWASGLAALDAAAFAACASLCAAALAATAFSALAAPTANALKIASTTITVVIAKVILLPPIII